MLISAEKEKICYSLLLKFDKEKYAIPYENVKLYVRIGLKLKKHIAY